MHHIETYVMHFPASHQETIELGGSDLGVFLGGYLPPPIPPLRANFVFLFFFELFFPLYSLLTFSFL